MLALVVKISKFNLLKLEKFQDDNNGSIVLLAAFLIPMLVMFSLVAVDISVTQASRTKVQASLDSAMLAAAVNTSNVDDLSNKQKTIEALSKNFASFIEANLSHSEMVDIGTESIDYDPLTKRVDATVTFTKPSLVALFNGEANPTYKVSASTYLSQPEKHALSMFLVLDKSGSMGWDKKMPALKSAVSQLSTKLSNEDPEKKFIRVGAVAYDSKQSKKYVRPTWGPEKANAYAKGLKASGGTNSSKAMKTAYQNMRHPREEKEHAKRNQGSLKRVIVFMTDGANNSNKYDKTTLYYCKQAKKLDIEIYSVAFQAPSRGQQLLKTCATSSSHYFEADNSSELVEAFEMIGETAARKLAIAR